MDHEHDNGNGAASRGISIDTQFWVKIAISIGIAVFFGYLVHEQGVRLVPRASDMSIVLGNWPGISAFVVSLIIVHVLRAYRWIYLLRPFSRSEIDLAHMIAVAFVGFFAIMALPLRTGEIARPYLISVRGHVTVSSAFGTIAVERALDGLVLSAVLTLCFLVLPLDRADQSWARPTGVATFGIFVLATLFLVLLIVMGETLITRLERLLATVWPRVAHKLADILRDFLNGLSSLREMKHLVPFMAMTLVYWGVNGIGMWVLARSCGLGISVIGGFTVMTMLGVGILLPTGPGHFGNFQVSVWLALSLLGVSEEIINSNGSVYIFMLYLLILLTTVGAGVVSLLTRHVSLRRETTPREGT
jgi:uncharacterized protein (TIRG00374 family)